MCRYTYFMAPRYVISTFVFFALIYPFVCHDVDKVVLILHHIYVRIEMNLVITLDYVKSCTGCRILSVVRGQGYSQYQCII